MNRSASDPPSPRSTASDERRQVVRVVLVTGAAGGIGGATPAAAPITGALLSIDFGISAGIV